MDSESKAVLILGMHRSGTSSLAGSLQENGLYLGKVIEWSPHNPKGNRENEEIMLINDAVLKVSGGSWYKPPIEISWNRELAEERDRVIQTFISSSEKIWGFKDPRTIFTLPFWKDGLPNIKIVGIFRHPLLVAKSLNARGKMPIEYGLELWKAYNIKLLLYFKENEFPIISFDVSQQEYQSAIRQIVEYLGINSKKSIDDMPFYDESLKKQVEVDSADSIPDEIMQIYDILNKIYQRQFAS